MTKTCGIYLITCKTTAIGYVGMSKNIERRWIEHSKRFSTSAFNYEVLEECEASLLGAREKHWIRECGTLAPLGFNETKGGQTGTITSHTEAAKLLMSQNRKGKGCVPRSEETRRKMSEAMKGNTACVGRKISEAHKQALAEGRRKALANKDGV